MSQMQLPSPPPLNRPAEGRLLAGALHVFALSSFAIAQPLLDLLSRTPTFFVARRSEPIDVVVLALCLCLALPAALVGLELAARALGRRAANAVHLTLVALLIALIALPPLKRVDALPGAAVLGLAAAIGVAAAVAYARLPAIRLFPTFLAPAPVVFVGLFLFATPVTSIVFPETALATSRRELAASTPVVLVVLDELPLASLVDARLAIDAARYPNFARLAARSTWFRNATAVSDLTATAIPAIVDGRYPRAAQAPIARNYPETLFTLLGSSYAVRAHEVITHLCPRDVCEDGSRRRPFAKRMRSLASDVGIVFLRVMAPRDMEEKLPIVARAWEGALGAGASSGSSPAWMEWEDMIGDRSGQFRRFLDRISPDEPRSLHFIHILLPHCPFTYLPSGKDYRGNEDWIPHQARWDSGGLQPILEYQRHLLQLGFVDRLVGELFARLRALGLYDRSLVIVTADHGVSFRAGEMRRRVTETNRHDLARIPLFVKAPGQRRGRTDDQSVESIDILPTIAHVLGIRVPWQVDGRSLLDGSAAERPEKRVYQSDSGKLLSFAPGLDGFRPALDHKLSFFGSGSPVEALFGLGDERALVGKSVERAGLGAASPLVAELEEPAAGSELGEDRASRPGCVRGRIPSADDQPITLAVAVNDVVRAVTRTFRPENGVQRFAAPVDEDSFRPGRNEVRVFGLTPQSIR